MNTPERNVNKSAVGESDRLCPLGSDRHDDQPGYPDIVERAMNHFVKTKYLVSATPLPVDNDQCRELLDLLPIGVYYAKEDGTVLYVNEKVRELLGAPDLQTLMRADAKRVFAHRTQYRRWRGKIERKGGGYGDRLSWRKFDNEVVDVWNRTFISFDAKLDSVTYLGVVEKLPSAPCNARFESVMRNSPIPCLSLDKNGRVAWASQAAQEFLGYENLSDLTDRHFVDLLRRRDRRRVERRLNAALLGCKSSARFQAVTMETKCEKFIPARIQMQAIDNGDESHGLLVYLENMSVQSELANYLCGDLEAIKAVADSLPVPIFIKDENHYFVYVNEAFAREIGVRPEDVIGRRDLDFYEEEFAAKYCSDDRLVMKLGKTLETIEWNRGCQGNVESVQVVKLPWRDDVGSILGVIGAYWPADKRQSLLAAMLCANPS